jgi:hypothetical protein
MKIAKYVQSLLPSFEKKTVRKNLDDLRSELRDHTLPPYESAHEMLRRWRFKDNLTQAIDKEFDKEVNSKFRGNYVEVIYFILKQSMDTIGVLEKMADANLGRDVVKSAMTYSDVQLMQLIEALSFAARYARKLLIYTLAVEVDLFRDNNLRGKELTPGEVNWLNVQRPVFYLVMRALSKSPKDIEDLFKNIPDVDVDVENMDTVAATVGARNLDPLGIGAHGLILNPIYHVRIALADWQVARYDAAKEERKMLEYQILDLKNAMEGKDDPKLEKALEYTLDRASRLDYKLRKMEEGT